MNRVINFSAGPSSIPLEVLKTAQSELLNYHNLGASIMEISHRTDVFERILNETKDIVKELYGFDDSFEVLFLQGGASLQFAMIPMNLALPNKIAQYANTGVWTQKAIKEAQILNVNYNVIASSEDENFSYIPDVKFDDNASYGYICSNNTIYGTQYKSYPKCNCPLIVDSSSDLFSREIDVSNIGLFYGGIQKNGGPSGVCMVVIKKELANRVSDSVPTLLRYSSQIDGNSMCNTPNTFGIYMLNLMLHWIKDCGGLKNIDMQNRKKAKILYECIDELSDFYQGVARPDSRSLMNVSFRIVDDSLTMKFVNEASSNGMIGLKGHRHIGGLRASIYNTITYENVEKLIDFMVEFRKNNR